MKRCKASRSSLNRKLTLQPLQARCLMAAGFGLNIEAAGRMDFGDAPASYGTTLADDGARHIPSKEIRLGKDVDAESDGQPSGSATLDGLDEDGIRFLGSLVAATGRGAIDAWADTNGDGRFDDSEKFIDGVSLSSGENYFLAPDAEYYRFRVSEKGGLDAIGFGGLGEVEDYKREIRWCPWDPPHDVPPGGPGDPGDADPIPEDLNRRDERKKLGENDGRPDDRGGSDPPLDDRKQDDREERESTSLNPEGVDRTLVDITWR